MKDPLEWMDEEFRQVEQAGLRRRLTIREGGQDAVVRVGGKELVNFGSNDYLGLAADERLYPPRSPHGWGSGASPLVTGRGPMHDQLERQLARFEGTEAALLFSSGYAANSGTIAALVGRGDVVYSDAKNHASIVDGCRLSRAETYVYRHGDVGHLNELLAATRSCRRKLIVTDSLFSMDGDFAPLTELVELADRYDAMLMVDEAHATGVIGELGRGVAEQSGVDGRVPIRLGTLSKALGSVGGFVAGSRRLIDWLVQRSRPYIYSTAPPEAIAAAGLAALRIVQDEPWRRVQLLQRAEMLRCRLAANGWNLGDSRSQIIPLRIGEPEPTMRIAERLREAGMLVPGIRPPTVPEGESLLRVSLSFGHNEEMLERLVVALNRCR